MNDAGTNNTGLNSTATNNTATNKIVQHLNALLVGKFDVPAQAVRGDATLGDLDLDSLARVELFITLEEHWAVAFDEDGGDDAAAAITVAQLVSRIRTLVSVRLAAAEQSAAELPASELPASESSAPGVST